MNRRAEAQTLFAQGVPKKRIARMLGISATSVYRYVDAAFDERQKRLSREAKARRARPCATPGCHRLARYAGHGGENISRFCEPCSKAWQSAIAVTRNPHGTRASYSRGCRCDACRAGNARYQRDWYQRHRQVAA